jgi:UPF0042 nucleotide-binding protein
LAHFQGKGILAGVIKKKKLFSVMKSINVDFVYQSVLPPYASKKLPTANSQNAFAFYPEWIKTVWQEKWEKRRMPIQTVTHLKFRKVQKMESIRFVIITGLSGAGKSETMKCFEDIGYFCVDNLPPVLIPKFAELCVQSDGSLNRIALVVDIRGGSFFDDIFEALENLEQKGFSYEILFLEAREDILVRRFKESRRRHPLSATGVLTEGIRAEGERLEEIRGKATLILDTSDISARELREKISQNYDQTANQEKMLITIVSFGFKNGIPLDVDLLFDVRFLPNPHYVDSLRKLNGNCSEVSEYVLKWPLATRFLTRLYDFIDFLVPQYRKEGKANLIIGIGCTGGQHRSVTIANKLGDFLRTRGYRSIVEHRDISK